MIARLKIASAIAIAFATFALASGTALGGPGAHGPNGEHLDAAPGAVVADTAPRLETASELYEIVARLEGGSLHAFVDAYATNEPVLGASVEVEAGTVKAQGRFDPATGDYVFDDPKLVAALSEPVPHALVFTVLAGDDADLLEGRLIPPADDHAHAHGLARGWWLALGAIVLLAVALLAWRFRERVAVRFAGATTLAVVALALLVAPPAHSHGDEPHADEETPTAVVRGAGLLRLPDGSLNVPKLAQRRMSIRTKLAPRTQAAATVELPGRVLMDPSTGGRVQPTHGGRIEAGPRGLPNVGARVRRGDVLAYVRHHQDPSARAEQQAQLAELRAGERIAAERAQRLESLEGSVARKDIEAAKAELEGYRARVRAIAGALDAREPLVAPVTGVLARADAIVGQVVDGSSVLFEIVDPAAITVEATTTDAAIATGVEKAALLGVPGVELQLVGAGRSLREGVLPLVFRATAKGAAPPIAVGQPVTVVAELGLKAEGVTLPAAALVRNSQNEPVVYIKSGAERFVPQPVQFQPLDASTILVTQGLAADNRVVVQGASLLAQIR